MKEIEVSSSAVVEERQTKSIHVVHKTKDITSRDGEGLIGKIFKEAPGKREQKASKQQENITTQPHPYNMQEVKKLTDSNEYHSTCISIKTAATVGVGFKTEGEEDRSKAEKELDDLTTDTFQAVLNAMCEDRWSIGNGYIEVVRDDDGRIAGIYSIEGELVYVVTEEDGEFHFEVRGGNIAGGSFETKKYARFGDLEDLIKRLEIEGEEKEEVGELIHFKNTSNKNKYYGFADWLSAVPSIELNQMFTQYLFDFFLNRGVPEFMLFITGAKVSTEDWAQIEASLTAQIGITNSHKSSAYNFPQSEIEIELHKLAMDQDSSQTFKDDSEATALKIVTAHKTPPLLAGIQISGKLGATNELPNALMAFQILTIGTAQKAITTTLDNTLGDSKSNGGLGLRPGDFKLKKITDELNLDIMSTVGGMRQTLPEAQAEGRNLSTGMKD